GRRRLHRVQRLIPGPARSNTLDGLQLEGRLGRLFPGGRRGAFPGRGVPPQPHPRGLLPDLWPEPSPRPPLERGTLGTDGHGAGRRGEGLAAAARDPRLRGRRGGRGLPAARPEAGPRRGRASRSQIL
ncbi:MAG: Zinc-type alcohol dehydrogenase YcjQ, partial [uncultured Rubrobacteraceae bacterium]